MKLVAVSVVKNEADVIEAFVRHTSAWADHHLIFDHDSSDGTRQILAELVLEGLPLSLFTGDQLGNLQQSRSNHLARLAFTQHGADWALPLDADEFLVAPSREHFENALRTIPEATPASLLLRNYSPTTADNPREQNPVLRIQHRNRGPGSTAKAFVPRALGLQDGVAAGKGNHVFYRDNAALPATMIADAWLAHFALRSPQQQVLRVLTAELQKLSRGRAHEGLDLHYRLGFQLLSEDIERFFGTVLQAPTKLKFDPAPYLGGALRYDSAMSDTGRTARALVPFLEKLAASHGRLVDRVSDEAVVPEDEVIRVLEVSAANRGVGRDVPAFSGFDPVAGWQPLEGPIPEAFLPPFHWATGPETEFLVKSASAKTGRLHAEVLTYSERQTTAIELNGREIHRIEFTRVNQKEDVRLELPLCAGDNRLVLRHTQWIESAADPRKLALIFLSLRIE